MVCRYTFDGPDGQSVNIVGRPALKAYLASGGLAHLLPERAAQAGFKRSPVAAAVTSQVDEQRMQRTEQVVQNISAPWAQNVVIKTVWDLNSKDVPEDVRVSNAKEMAENSGLGSVKGFYHPKTNTVYMVASQLNGDFDIARVLLHETLGHWGLNNLYGQGLKSVLQQIMALRKADTLAKLNELKLPKTMADARAAALKNQPNLTGNALEEAATRLHEGAYLEAAEEVLADMAMNTPQIGFVQRALAAIKTWLRQHVPGFANMKLSDAEIIRDFLLPARAFVEQGTEAGRATANQGIRFNRAPANPAPAATSLTPEEQGTLRRTQANFQDNNNRIKQIQTRITELTGAKVPEYADYYMAEDNRPGRIAARLQDFREKMRAPLIERIVKSGHTLDQVEELAHAMHAQERNERGGKLHPEDSDFYKAMDDHSIVGTSGMSTDKANEIIKKYRSDAALQKHASDLRKIARAALDIKLASERITQEEYDAYVNAYQNYVPLKGDGEYGPGVKRAMGHEERDEHIMENVMRDYEQAVVSSERNLTRQAFLQLVLENPDSDLWTVGVAPKGRYIAGQSFNVYKDGEVVAEFDSEAQARSWVDGRMDNYASYTIEIERGKFTVERDGKPVGYFDSHSKAEKYIDSVKELAGKLTIENTGERVREFVKPLQENELPVYVKGQMVRIQLKDETLAGQMRPLNQEQMGWVLGQFRDLNRFLSKIYTGYSPTFLITNPIRDAGTGTVSMVGNQGAVIAAKAWAKYPSAFKALAQYAANGKEPNTEVGRLLKEYRMSGGKTGASHMSDLEEQGKTLQRLYDDAYGASGYLAQGKTGKAALIAGRKILGNMAHVIEVGNQATENALRLSLYMTLRENGSSAGEAAQAAKNVTVNFDRKGSQTATMSALYLFFNPAVQGTANAIRTLVKGKHKEQAWIAVGVLAALGMYAAGQGIDDDEDRWLGEGWDNRSKKLVLNIGGKRITIPMSLEFAPFYAFGVAMEEARRGKVKPIDAAGHMISSFLDAYVPFKGVYSSDSNDKPMDLVTAAVPTALRPAVEAATNRNSFGSKIVPENEFTKDRPDNLKMNRATKGTAYDAAAQGIAAAGEALGAGKYENDITKVSPEMLKHWWRTYTGGLGSFLGDTASLAKIAAESPNSIEMADVPVVKAFAKGQDVSPIRGRFYELTKEARATITEFEQAKKAGDDEALDKIMSSPEKEELVGLGRMIRSTTKAAAGIRDEMVDINADKTLSLAEKRAKLKALEKEEETLYRDAIKAFQR